MSSLVLLEPPSAISRLPFERVSELGIITLDHSSEQLVEMNG